MAVQLMQTVDEKIDRALTTADIAAKAYTDSRLEDFASSDTLTNLQTVWETTSDGRREFPRKAYTECALTQHVDNLQTTKADNEAVQTSLMALLQTVGAVSFFIFWMPRPSVFVFAPPNTFCRRTKPWPNASMRWIMARLPKTRLLNACHRAW